MQVEARETHAGGIPRAGFISGPRPSMILLAGFRRGAPFPPSEHFVQLFIF